MREMQIKTFNALHDGYFEQSWQKYKIAEILMKVRHNAEKQ